jgi:HlyD family secretion protein
MTRNIIKPWLAVLAAACCTACEKPDEGEAGEDPSTRRIHAVGYLEPPGELRRLAFPEDGVIQRVHVGMGDLVKQGTALAELDSPLAERELARACAHHATAVAELRRLKAGIHPDLIAAADARLKVAAEEMKHREAEAIRFKSLVMSRGVSEAEADQAAHEARAAEARWVLSKSELEALRNQPRREELELAEANVKVAEAEIEMAREHLERRTLRAPADGRILEVMKREGEAFSNLAQDVAILFAPEGSLEVRVEVDELDAHKIKNGMEAVVSIKGDGAKASGTIDRIKPVMGRKTVFNRRATERMDLQVVEAWIQLKEPVDWTIGMEVDVEIRLHE